MDVHVYELLHSLIVAGGVVGVFLVLGPVWRALARRLDPKARSDPAVTQDLEELRGRLEQQGQQVMELAERLDFAERMLSQRRDAAALPEGGK